MKMRLVLAWMAAALVPPVAAQTADWKQFDFLVGKWTAVAAAKDTQLGDGSGACSFEFDLGRKIIVRRSSASYDSGIKHTDLMILYVEGASRAIYFDDEGHVIRYKISVPAANRVVLESEGTEPGPRFRLTYWLDGALLNVKFEIAPPGSDYKSYTGASMKRDETSR